MENEDSRPMILVTNDDGANAAGVQALFAAMREIGQAVMVAPEHDSSAASHSLTMRRPLRVRQHGEAFFTVDGTPTDCVIIAVGKILPRRPAIVVSGINPGENLGDDISYSGTVSAAIEGTMLGIPSFAVSLCGEDPQDFMAASRIAGQIARYVLRFGLPAETLLNVNVPAAASVNAEIRFTRQGRRGYEGAIKETADPWGRRHYWIGGGTPSWDAGHDTDAQAVLAGAISVTPIHLDLTNHQALATLRENWRKNGANDE